jgi:hypothetical protein
MQAMGRKKFSVPLPSMSMASTHCLSTTGSEVNGQYSTRELTNALVGEQISAQVVVVTPEKPAGHSTHVPPTLDTPAAQAPVPSGAAVPVAAAVRCGKSQPCQSVALLAMASRSLVTAAMRQSTVEAES